MIKWELKRFDEHDIPEDLDADIRLGLQRAFPADREFFEQRRAWSESSPEFSFIAQGEERLLGHVGVVRRVVRVGGEEFTAGGIQSVFVESEMKGSGLSGDLVRAAVGEMARRDYDCGLLFCLPALEKVYAPMGWHHLAGRKIVTIAAKNIAMFYPLKTSALPPGDLDLQGPDW